MSAYQSWLDQRDRLRTSLASVEDTAGVARQVRHTLAQVEQNTMAEQPDDLLRQQTGILFSCVKTSLNLIDISVTTKVWVAQKQATKESKPKNMWALLLSLVIQAGIASFAYLDKQWLLLILTVISLLAVLFGLVKGRRKHIHETPAEDRLKVTAVPEADKLFHAIDAQMQAIDRYILDFAYLNEQLTLQGRTLEVQNVPQLAELMQAVYGCEGEAAEDAKASADRLLGNMGIQAVAYDDASAQYYTVLPSLTETRTLVPALVSKKDGLLLYRGTAAAVQTEPMAEHTPM